MNSHTHLVRVFLYFKFLELYELGASGLQVETSPRLIYTTVSTWTQELWHEAGGMDLWR